jgi:hypothetical protein
MRTHLETFEFVLPGIPGAQRDLSAAVRPAAVSTLVRAAAGPSWCCEVCVWLVCGMRMRVLGGRHKNC